eukprot:2627766-Prymnesium_polylepis.1
MAENLRARPSNQDDLRFHDDARRTRRRLIGKTYTGSPRDITGFPAQSGIPRPTRDFLSLAEKSRADRRIYATNLQPASRTWPGCPIQL